MTIVKLDKRSGALPAYQQIIGQIEKQIQSGVLRPGDKLLPEREMAEILGTARGTIQKAYEELVKKGLIEAAQGRGSFVAAKSEIAAGDRKERAAALIDNLLNQLVRLNFTYAEIKAFFDLRLLGREEIIQSMAIAAVDCNPEALAIYEKQIFIIPYVNLAKYLMDDLMRDPAKGRQLSQFDLILTTPTHYHEVVARFPELEDKILQVAVAPTRDSIIRLARLTPSQRVGVVCESRRFFEIITNHLKDFSVPADHVRALFTSDLAGLDTFIQEVDAVIVPPGYSLLQRQEHKAAVQAFTERGGIVIPFDYKIERGSLLHVEERIRAQLETAAAERPRG